MTVKPPLGVLPLWRWREMHPEPSLGDLLSRYADVAAAVARYRWVGRSFPEDWLRELLGAVPPGTPRADYGRDGFYVL